MEIISSGPYSIKTQFEARPIPKTGTIVTNSHLIFPKHNSDSNHFWEQLDVWSAGSTPTYQFTLGDQLDDQMGNVVDVNWFLLIPYLNHPMQAWSTETGEKIALEAHWQVIDRLAVSERFIVHTNAKDPNKFYLSDAKTLKLVREIPTQISGTLDLIISDDKVIHIGLLENGDGQLTLYTNIYVNDDHMATTFSNEVKIGHGNFMYSLDLVDGMIFNHNWSNKSTFVWDANNLEELLKVSRETIQFDFQTALLPPFAAVVDDEATTVAIYEKQPDQTEMVLLHNLPLSDSKENALVSLHLFTFASRTIGCTGFFDGKVKIWDLKTGDLFAELSPLPGMCTVCSMQMAQDKLLVHYGDASEDGTIALIWDLEKKEPYFNITIDSLAHKNYQRGNWDDVFVTNEGNLIVRCQNQAIIYKSNSDSNLGRIRMPRARNTGKKVEEIQKPILNKSYCVLQ